MSSDFTVRDFDCCLVDDFALKENHFSLFSACFVDFVMEMRSFRSSWQSVFMLVYSSGVIMAVSFNNSSQYLVSAHSFNEIVAFCRNSFFVIAYWASARFEPIDVPERNSCFDRIYSRLVSS